MPRVNGEDFKPAEAPDPPDAEFELPVEGFTGTPEEIERQWFEKIYRGRGDSMRQLTWRAVLMGRGELLHRPSARASGGAPAWQADVYLEGSDQHRGWFQSSLLLSLAGSGLAPFKTVLTHGFMVDADREKIAKSRQDQGVYEKPQTAQAYVSRYGADVVRLWVASQDYRGDIIVNEERINKVAETYRNLRNTLRYQLSNLFDFDPAAHWVEEEKLTGLERWVLAKFSKLEQAVAAAYEGDEFHAVYQRIGQFAAVELSAIYHDAVKDRLYTDPANSARRRSCQTALHRMVTGLCQMLSPVLAFTADEAWEHIPKSGADSVHLSLWQPSGFAPPESEQREWEKLFEIRRRVLPCLERERQAKSIGKALDAKVLLAWRPGSGLEVSAHRREELRELLNVSQLVLLAEPKDAAGPELEIEVTKADGQKCERCWHWEIDVGAHPEHPTLCGRCVEAVKGYG